jgi:asparagine synthase (glutamine-hydrolysing)
MPFCCVVVHDHVADRESVAREMAQRVAGAAAPVGRLTSGDFVALGPSHDVLGRPLQATYRDHIGMGVVRLDNRTELARVAPGLAATASDLELVLAVLWHHGAAAIRQVLGDFGFVRWEPRTARLLAFRDALGVKPLFYAASPHYTLVSDRLGFVGDERRPDREFLADFLVAGGDPAATHTIWANARSVPPAAILRVEAGRVTQDIYWSALECPLAVEGGEDRHTEEFRHRFDEAVRRRTSDRPDVWAELSGGTDSSSIVATAQVIAGDGQGLAGTLTLADELGSGDERRYSDLIVRRFRLLNEVVLNPWPWQTDADGPPLTDEPRVMYPYYARDRRMCAVIRRHGARVLLSGLGADHYLSGLRLYLADWIAQGRLQQAARGILAWAMHDRVSFWATLLKEGVWPFIPRRVRAAWLPPEERPPDWIAPAFAHELDLIPRLNLTDNPSGPIGRFFPHATVQGLQNLPHWFPLGPFQDDLEVRYPFLDRQLLEFTLRLPPECRVRPGAPKWILRAAMQGRVPDEIRLRRGKGHIGARAVWALRHERSQLQALTRDPILAQLGCIDPGRLRNALEAAWRGHVPNTVLLLSVLALETWLAVRYKRWTAVTTSITRATTARKPDASSIRR